MFRICSGLLVPQRRPRDPLPLTHRQHVPGAERRSPGRSVHTVWTARAVPGSYDHFQALNVPLVISFQLVYCSLKNNQQFSAHPPTKLSPKDDGTLLVALCLLLCMCFGSEAVVLVVMSRPCTQTLRRFHSSHELCGNRACRAGGQWPLPPARSAPLASEVWPSL